MENKVISFDQSFARYSRRVGIAEAQSARAFHIIKGAEITVLFEKGDRQNELLDKQLAKRAIIFSANIPPIVA